MTRGRAWLLGATLLLGACAGSPAPASGPAASPSAVGQPAVSRAGGSRQLVVVTTARWDTTGGVLRKFERASGTDAWRQVGGDVPVVVGRTGIAWGDDALAGRAEPRKREGDGRAPAGRFPLDTAFGFAAAAPWVRLPYVPLTDGSECVDDVASAHYNTVVDRTTVPRVDWSSAEHMRRIPQYRLGVIVGYNATPPRAGRGSCIFLHIWAGPGTSTAGCTAMAETDLTALMLWLDRERRPELVQLTTASYLRLRSDWGLP